MRPCEFNLGIAVGKRVPRTLLTSIILDSSYRLDDFGNITAEQIKDGDLEPLLRWWQEGSDRPARSVLAPCSSVTKAYVLDWRLLRPHDGALQRKWEVTDGLVTSWLYVIPKQLKATVLSSMHNHPSVGHFGVKKTLSRFCQRFYWVAMRNDVSEWCKSCHVCGARHGPLERHRSPSSCIR